MSKKLLSALRKATGKPSIAALSPDDQKKVKAAEDILRKMHKNLTEKFPEEMAHVSAVNFIRSYMYNIAPPASVDKDINKLGRHAFKFDYASNKDFVAKCGISEQEYKTMLDGAALSYDE